MPKSSGTKRNRVEWEAKSPEELPDQTRTWDFTLNNYTPEEEEHIQQSSEYRFCLYGHEIAPTTGTPHLQGMVIFKNAKTRGGVIKVLGPRISCRQLYSSVDSLMDYCEKGADTWEKGVRPVTPEDCGLQGKARTVDILRLAKAGLFDELELTYPDAWFYQQKAIMTARGHMLKNNVSLDGILDNYWIFGESGQGKGMYVDSLTQKYYPKAAETKWWDGFDGEEDVVIDDVGAPLLAIWGQFKQWTDRKPFTAEVKGAGWLIRPKRVFVTAHKHPSHYIKDPDELMAILRRFQLVEIVNEEAIWYERERVAQPKLAVRVVGGVWQPKPPTPIIVV